MASLAKAFLLLCAGLALGLGLTAMATASWPLFGAVHIGAWTAWPASGSPDADPYAVASFARQGRIPLSTAVGLRFLADADESGAPLDWRCDYEVAGQTPTAQFWTVSLLDRNGFLAADANTRSSFTSAETLRAADGTFAIEVSSHARAGNWLPAPTGGRFVLMLSFYDTPIAASLAGSAIRPVLPTLVRRACG